MIGSITKYRPNYFIVVWIKRFIKKEIHRIGCPFPGIKFMEHQTINIQNTIHIPHTMDIINQFRIVSQILPAQVRILDGNWIIAQTSVFKNNICIFPGIDKLWLFTSFT